jgi:hypothetical protein
MALEKSKKDLEHIAANVVESLEDLIQVMQDAADSVSLGLALEDAPVGDYQVYLAREKTEGGQSQAKAVVCIMDFEDYIHLLEKTAAEEGICLDESTELKVNLPEAEFGEDMVSGGFENFKGITVEVCNDCLNELMGMICSLLEARGLSMACVPDEDVIFYMPLFKCPYPNDRECG